MTSQAAPDQDLIWRVKVTQAASSGPRPLDGLPAATAAWWPGWQLLSAYVDPLLQCEGDDGVPSVSPGAGVTGQVLAALISAEAVSTDQDEYARQLFDQSGNGRALTAAALPNGAPVVCSSDGGFEQQNLSLALGYFSNGNAMSRGDALGLGSDPALTIAFKLQTDTLGPGGDAPNVLALGTALTPELCVFVNTLVSTDDFGVTNFEGTAGANWLLPASTISKLHSYVVTKPAGSGYDVTGWKLYVDGVDQGSPVSAGGGALALGSTITQLGDVPAGGFPLLGTLAGCIVWAEVLDIGQLAQLQAFLDSV